MKTHWLVGLTVALAVLTLSIAGCGGSSSTSSSGTSTSGGNGSGSNGTGGNTGGGGNALSSSFGDYKNDAVANQAYIQKIPSGQFLVCGWTRVNAKYQTWGKGNDYPFYIHTNGNRGTLTISGNLISPGTYNQNTTLADGDRNTVYLPVTLQQALGWVFVAWHFNVSGNTVTIKQYSKFGVDGEMVLNSTDSGPLNEPYTGIWLGANPYSTSDGMNLAYVRVYEMSAPTTTWLNTVALNPNADSTAWADWSLVNDSLVDRSGHGRDLTMSSGIRQSGAAVPALP